MRLYRHYSDVPADARGAIATIGNFDGLHLGHQAVIAHAVAAARSRGAPSAVITFEPHPYGVFRPGAPPFRLTPFRIKASLLEVLGLDFAYVLPFDAALYQKTAEEFVADVLVGGLGVAEVVIGADFVFGKDRGGNIQVLGAAARRHGFGLAGVAQIGDEGGTRYSSTKVRQYLTAGQPHLAAAQLGRAWAIEGRVECGDRRGRTIGFPTANLHLGEHLIPAAGVYAVRAAIVDRTPPRWIDGVANLGVRPTVDGETLLLETHLFDFDGDLYQAHLRVALIEYLRPEKKFDGLDDLKAQIARDSALARDVLGRDATPLEIGHRRPPVVEATRIV